LIRLLLLPRGACALVDIVRHHIDIDVCRHCRKMSLLATFCRYDDVRQTLYAADASAMRCCRADVYATAAGMPIRARYVAPLMRGAGTRRRAPAAAERYSAMEEVKKRTSSAASEATRSARYAMVSCAPVCRARFSARAMMRISITPFSACFRRRFAHDLPYFP